MNHFTGKLHPLVTLWSILLLLALSACQQTAAPTTEAAAPANEQPASNDAAQSQAAPPTPTEAAAEAAEAEADTADTAADGATTFQIVPESSEARFIIDEVLRGQPTTVVGVTSDLSGDIQVDPANPAQTQIGTIEINADSFVTDSDRRNGAIDRFILQTAQHPLITFEPTAIEGLPESVGVGEGFEFQVTGDLKIRDVVQPVTFDVSVTANSENEISGLGSTTIQRGDYSLTIPSVPFVADVSEAVALEIEFVAQTN